MKITIRQFTISFLLIISSFSFVFSSNNHSFFSDNESLIESTFTQISTLNLSPEEQTVLNKMESIIDSIKLYSDTNTLRAIEFGRDLHVLADKHAYDDFKIEANLYIGKDFGKLDAWDTAFVYFNKAMVLSEQTKDTLSLCKAYQGISNYYNAKGELIIAVSYLKRIYDLREAIEDIHFLSTTMYSLANQNKDLGNYNDALNFFMVCLKYREALGGNARLASVHVSIGNIYRHISDLPQAIEYTNQADSLYQMAGIESSRVPMQNGLIHLDLDEYEAALEDFLLANELYKKSNDKRGMGRALNNIGISLSNLGKKEEALENQFKALALKKETNDFRYLGSTYNNISNAYLKMGKYNQAKSYLDSSFQHNHKLQLKSRLMSNYDSYHEFYSKLGDYKKALDYYKLHSQIKDTIFSNEIQRKISGISALYELEIKANENLVLTKDNQIHKLELDRQLDLRNLFIAISSIVILLILFVYYQYHVKSKTNKSLSKVNELITSQRELLKETNATKDKFFSIIAHDLISPFNSILGFADILETDYEEIDDSKRKNIIRNIVKSTKDTLNLVENLLTWARSQRGSIKLQVEKIDLYTLVENSVATYHGSAIIKGIQISNQIDKNYFVYVDCPSIKTVIGNIINNAIKFSFSNTSIVITAIPFEYSTEIWIKDSGVGLNPEKLNNLFKIEESYSSLGTKKEKGTGLGLIICKEFVEKNGGSIRVQSEEGIGSTIIVKLPNKAPEKKI